MISPTSFVRTFYFPKMGNKGGQKAAEIGERRGKFLSNSFPPPFLLSDCSGFRSSFSRYLGLSAGVKVFRFFRPSPSPDRRQGLSHKSCVNKLRGEEKERKGGREEEESPRGIAERREEE